MKVTKLLFNFTGFSKLAKNVRKTKANEINFDFKLNALNFQHKYRFALIQQQ